MNSYKGETLTNEQCDKLALERFSLKLFEGESELQQLCWFDYKHDHPVKRTYRFAAEYMKAYKALYMKYIDCDADHIYGLSRPNDPLDNDPPKNKKTKLRTPTCLWRARQVADGLGMPYDFYVSTALEQLFRTRYKKTLLSMNAENKQRLNIQASAMYSDELVAHVAQKWEEYQKARIIWSENEALAFTPDEMALKNAPHEYKLAYEKYLIKQIYQRTMRDFALDTAIQRGYLRPQIAYKIFGYEQEHVA